MVPFILFFGLTESILRYSFGLKQHRYTCHYPILDNQYCPNVTGVHENSGKSLRTNSAGLLDQKDYPKERIPGSFRIAVLGDSFTAGEEVEDGYEFHAVWEKQLPEQVGFPVEVLNFGVSGIGPWKQLQTYHLRVREYKPDLTVLVLYWENDFYDALSKFKKGKPNPLLNEYPVTSWFQRLQVVRKNINQWLWNNSAIYQFSRLHHRTLGHPFRNWFQSQQQQKTKTVEPLQTLEDMHLSAAQIASIDNPLLDQYPPLPGVPPMEKPKVDTPSPHDDPYFWNSESWDLIRKLLLQLKKEVEAEGGSLMVTHFMAQNHYAERHPLPAEKFNQFLQTNGIAVIDPNSYYFRMSRQELAAQYIPGDLHFNEEGHATLVEATLDSLSELVSERALVSPLMNK